MARVLVEDLLPLLRERRSIQAYDAAHGLDDAVPHDRLGTVSLRWIYVHMIEETARHVGHEDILREQTDGSTGFG